MVNVLKKIILSSAVFVGTAAMLSGCGTVETVIAEVKTKLGVEQETETELAAGQRKAEITVVSIVGNELTYRENETEAPETEANTEIQVTETEMDTKADAENFPEHSETEMSSETDVPESNAEQMSGGGNFPDMGQMPGGGGFPDMSQMQSGGSFPDMSQMQGGGSFPDMSSMQEGGSFPDMSSMQEMFAQMAGETVYLPVGIKVHADNGKDATFSILEEGDVVLALFDTKADGTEVITEIWMEGTY